MRIKKIALALVVTILLIMLAPTIVHATDETSHGNAWVYDDAQIVSQETLDYVENLNENVFANYAGHPQLAVIVVKDLPYNIDKYKLDMFNELEVGTADENRGMLFVLAINDRQYALEIGDGFEKGSLLRKDLETDFITEDMRNLMRSGDYDAVLRQVSEHLANLMADEENGVYAQREAEIVAKNQEAANVVIEQINNIGAVTYTDECHDKITAAMNAYRRLTTDQKELVTNYNVLTAANDRYNELANEAFMAGLKKVGIVLAITCPIVGLVLLCVYLIKKAMRKKKVNELINKCHRQIRHAELDEEDIRELILGKESAYNEYSIQNIKDEFLNILYEHYINVQVGAIQNRKHKMCKDDAYISELYRVNDRPAFNNCQLTSLAIIVANVDAVEKQRISIDNDNKALLDKFWRDNLSRIENVGIISELKKSMKQLVVQNNGQWRLTQREFEECFIKAKNELDFRAEFDKFLIANKDKIDHKDFDTDAFYRDVTSTSNYANYHYQRRYDRSWMLPLMMMHMHNRKEKRIERERSEKRERQERERRQREEAARRSAERMRSNNSSFGSSFGGGRSSGGGFKGGW